MQIIKLVLLAIFAYGIGNINFARILSSKKEVSITQKGSKNPGTINMLRSYGAKLGGITLLLDISKGALPAIVGFFVMGGYSNPQSAILGMYLSGFFVVLGHIYPIFFKFKGGKGVACSLGVFLVANPLATLIAFIIAVVYLWFFEYGSISSLIMITALVIIEGIKIAKYQSIIITLFLFGIFFLTWFAHRQNIFRLLIGKENRLSLKKLIKRK